MNVNITIRGHNVLPGSMKQDRGRPSGAVVVDSSCYLPRGIYPADLMIPKQLSAVKREQLYDEVLASLLSVSVKCQFGISNIDD